MAEELLSRYEELNLLYSISAELTSTLDVQKLCELTLERAFTVLGASHGGIVLSDAQGIRLRAVHAGSPLKIGDILPPGQSLAELATMTGEPVIRDSTDPDLVQTVVRRAGQPALAVPLLAAHAGQPALGALSLLRRVDGTRFSASDIRLAQAIASQLAARIAVSRLFDEHQEADRVRRDMQLAAAVQRALLPELPDELAGLRIAARSTPAAGIGGDLYDLIVDHEGAVWLLLADVAGHNIGSALLMAGVRVVLRSEVLTETGTTPGIVLHAANARLYDELVRAEHLVTAACARWEPWSGALVLASAGHNPALIRRTDGTVETFDADGTPLGLLKHTEYVELGTTLLRGELLLLHSDGVVEARNGTSEQFGEDRLHAYLAAASAPVALVESLTQAVSAYLDGDPTDDVTLLAVMPA